MKPIHLALSLSLFSFTHLSSVANDNIGTLKANLARTTTYRVNPKESVLLKNNKVVRPVDMKTVIDMDLELHRFSAGNSLVFTAMVPTLDENGEVMIDRSNWERPTIYRNLGFHYGYIQNERYEDGFNLCGCDIQSFEVDISPDKKQIIIEDSMTNFLKFSFANPLTHAQKYHMALEEYYFSREGKTSVEDMIHYSNEITEIDPTEYEGVKIRLVFEAMPKKNQFKLPVANVAEDGVLNLRKGPGSNTALKASFNVEESFGVEFNIIQAGAVSNGKDTHPWFKIEAIDGDKRIKGWVSSINIGMQQGMGILSEQELEEEK